MSNIISNAEATLQHLSQGLKTFGLNPKHWQVFDLSSSKAAAVHRSENLVLLGSITQSLGRTLWTELEIYDRDEIHSETAGV